MTQQTSTDRPASAGHAGSTTGSASRDATATAAAIRAGEVTAREVVADAIARIEQHDPALNAVVARRFDDALAEVDAGLPDGPLAGVPTLVKDLGMPVAGLPLTRGSRLWAEDVQPADGELVARYRRAGMVVLGMSNSPELGKNASTEPVLHGPTHNPWRPGYSPGGSSGGSAAAVAAGLLPVAHGNDGGGSLRIPGAMCGLVGLKPSRGRVSAYPDPGVMAYPLAANHALTRSVRDSALLLDLAAVPLPGQAVGTPTSAGSYSDQVGRDPGRLRIGLLVDRPDQGTVDRQVVEATERTARHLQEQGHEVTETSWPHDPERMMGAFATLMGVSLLSQVDQRLATLGRELADDDLEPFTRVMYDHYSTALTATTVHDALCACQEVAWQLGRRFAEYDLLLAPTLPHPVPEHGVLDTTDPAVMYERGGEFSAFTALCNVTGSPAVSVPAGSDQAGLPIGVQLIADFGREDLLLQAAAQLEQVAPWPLVAPGYA